MKVILSFAAAAAALLMTATPSLAHHAFSAEFDSSKPITLRGKLIKMDWINPHSWIHMEVINADTGKTETWELEAGPPNTLYRNGWRKDSIKPGEEIVVTGTMARNAPFTGNARSVKTTDGRTLLAGSSENQGAPSQGGPPK